MYLYGSTAKMQHTLTIPPIVQSKLSVYSSPSSFTEKHINTSLYSINR